jgi:ribosome-associated translation inhibitor RaiA
MFFATLATGATTLSSTKMQIRVDVDEHIDGSEELMVRVEGVIEGSLDRYQDRIARVEVHLSQLSQPRAGTRDLSCRMEAHASGLQPIAASHEAMTLTEAIHGASAKLERAVHAALGRVKKGAPAPMEEEEGSAEGLGHLESP